MHTQWTEPVLPELQKDNGTVDHIVLNDLYIHDVTGNVYKQAYDKRWYLLHRCKTNE